MQREPLVGKRHRISGSRRGIGPRPYQDLVAFPRKVVSPTTPVLIGPTFGEGEAEGDGSGLGETTAVGLGLTCGVGAGEAVDPPRSTCPETIKASAKAPAAKREPPSRREGVLRGAWRGTCQCYGRVRSYP